MKVYVAHQTPAGPVMQAQDDNVSFVRVCDDNGNYVDLRMDGDMWIVVPSFRNPRISPEFNINEQSIQMRIRK